LKKIILESIGLNTKLASIILLKQERNANPENTEQLLWTPFTDKDYDQ